MKDVLLCAVEATARERGGPYTDAFAMVEALLAEYGEESLANRIVAEVPLSIPWEVVADILGILEWSTSDNGAALHLEAEQWLIDGQDLRKMQIALNLDCYPFLQDEQMYDVLGRLADAVPELENRCKFLIRSRRLKAAQ